MTDTTDRPLVTFAVTAYNQDGVIREAIEGAFAQTYEPLEIILSDDGSPDRTYEIMQEMAAAYDGPHKVVLNRNEPNLGLVPHIDRLMELAQGAFFVVSAGDDISLPERSARLAEIWHSSNGQVSLVHSNAAKFSDDDDFLGYRPPPEIMKRKPKPEEIIDHGLHVVGATAGWDRRVFDDFGPLAPGLEIEDHIIPFRASLIGDIIYIDDALVRNRIGGMTKREAKRSYNFLYGSYNNARKWIAETDDYFLTRFDDVVLDGREELEKTCRRRSAIFGYKVTLAESSRLKRFLSFPYACSLTARFKSVDPLKDYIRYNLDVAYMAYAEKMNFSPRHMDPKLSDTSEDRNDRR